MTQVGALPPLLGQCGGPRTAGPNRTALEYFFQCETVVYYVTFCFSGTWHKSFGLTLHIFIHQVRLAQDFAGEGP